MSSITATEQRGRTSGAAFAWPVDERDKRRVVRHLGVAAEAFATIQIDLNVVPTRDDAGTAEITLCEHNCTVEVDGEATGGGYTCPAALSLNRGKRRGGPASGGRLIEALSVTIDGLRRAQAEFLRCDLDAYYEAESIPDWLRPAVRACLREPGVVVNLFGGSPETHPAVLGIIRFLHERGAKVHLTTTGRRILRDDEFREAFLREPADVIGLAADDFGSVSDMNWLFDRTYEELGRLWSDTPWKLGQRRKAIAAVQICKLAAEVPFPRLLFNIVLHPGNLSEAAGIMDGLTERAGPGVLLNPYPVQTAFRGEKGVLRQQDLFHLSDFAEEAIESLLTRAEGGVPRWNLVPRIGYWVLMHSVLYDDPGPAGVPVQDRIGGLDIWRCYSGRGAGRCVQIGAAGSDSQSHEEPGGHLGCFWNRSTITDSRQVWGLGGEEVCAWVMEGRTATANLAAEPCAGCLFPRISTDSVSLELGLSPSAVPAYREARGRVLGY